MTSIKELRLQARLSIAALSHLAQVDRKTIEKAEDGQSIRAVKAYAIVSQLGERLGRKLDMNEVEGLNVL